MNDYEDINEIETINIENFDGILRERVRRIIRKTASSPDLGKS